MLKKARRCSVFYFSFLEQAHGRVTEKSRTATLLVDREISHHAHDIHTILLKTCSNSLYDVASGVTRLQEAIFFANSTKQNLTPPHTLAGKILTYLLSSRACVGFKKDFFDGRDAPSTAQGEAR